MKIGILGLGLAAIALVSCGGEVAQEQDAAGASGESEKLSVVASGGVPCDLTKQVAGDSVEVTCLMEPGQDPHSYQLTAGDRRKLEEADLIIYGGLGLEESLGQEVFTASEVTAIPVFEKAVPEPLLVDGDPHADHDHGHDHGDHEGEGHADHGEEKHEDHADHDEHGDEKHGDHGEEAHADHADHDEHGDEKHGDHAGEEKDGKFVDPHVWHDAILGAASVKVVADALAGLNPDGAAEYEARAVAIAQELELLDGWIRTQIGTVPEDRRLLVTAHDAFRYYAATYGLEVPGTLGSFNHDEEPSAQELARLVDRIKELQVPVIFSETTVESENTLQAVARSAGIELAETPLFVDGPGGEGSGAVSYQEMLEVNTCAIATGLGGTCTPPAE